MRKVLGIFLTLLLTLTLIACDQRIKHDVEVVYKEVNATTTSVDIKFEVKDEKEELSDKIFISIREDKSKTDKEQKEIDLKKEIEEEDDNTHNVTFSGLEEGKKYFIYIRGTIKEKSVLLTKEPKSFVTEAPKDIDIYTKEDFYKINDKLNYNYYLKKDLDFSGEDQETIDKNVIKTFTGNFEGNGFTIKNYKTTKSNTSIGLFGQLSKNATVKNLKLDNIEINIDSNITGSRYAGILFGQAQSTSVVVDNIEIANSKINLTNINGNSNYIKVGFLGGVSTSEIKNINILGDNEININQRRFGTARVGGLLGHRDKAETKLENIYLEGSINYSLVQYTETVSGEETTYKYEGLRGKGGDLYIGGFIGESVESDITNVVSKVDVNVNDLKFVIESESQLDDKNDKKNISIQLYVGGLFGYLSSPVKLENLAYSGDVKVVTPSIENQVKEDDEIKELEYEYKLYVRVGSIAGILNAYNQDIKNVYRVGGSLNTYTKEVEDEFSSIKSGVLFGIAEHVQYNVDTNRFGLVGTRTDSDSVVVPANLKEKANLLDVVDNENFIYKKLK